jgi:hypothetical protein
VNVFFGMFPVLSVFQSLFDWYKKARSGHEIVKALVKKGLPPEKIGSVLPPSRWVAISGELSTEDFQIQLSKLTAKNGGKYVVKKWFYEDGELFRANGKTYSLTNQWGLGVLPQLDELVALLPTGNPQITYEKEKE